MSILLTKPIKNINYVCYRHPKRNIYRMANKDGKMVGYMVAYPEYVSDSQTYYPDKKGYFSLYIKRFFIDKNFRKQGAGKALLNIAANDSYKRSCEGRVHLIAQALGNDVKPPQKFYRKCGYDSQNKSHIELIDKALKEKTELPKNFWITPMFKPEKKLT